MYKRPAARILGFNGLRALCVIAVFLSHKCDLKFYAAPLGVWAFLVLSGFLIIGELNKARCDIEAGYYGTGTAWKIFIVKRALRILPAYYALLLLLFIAKRLYGPPGTDLGFAWHAIYLSNYFTAYVSPDSGSPFGVLWTLSVEQQFYVFAPLAFLLCPSRWHRCICAGVIFVAATAHLSMQSFGVSDPVLYLTSPWNFAIIALGGFAGISMRSDDQRFRVHGSLSLVAILTLIGAYSASWLIIQSPDPVGGLSTIVVSFALMLLVVWIRCNQESAFVRALEWRPLEYLGVISYGFYLVHNFVPSRSISSFLGLGGRPVLGLVIGTSISFFVSVAIAHVSWQLYERPLLKLRARLLPKRRLPTNLFPEMLPAGEAAALRRDGR